MYLFIQNIERTVGVRYLLWPRLIYWTREKLSTPNRAGQPAAAAAALSCVRSSFFFFSQIFLFPSFIWSGFFQFNSFAEIVFSLSLGDKLLILSDERDVWAPEGLLNLIARIYATYKRITRFRRERTRHIFLFHQQFLTESLLVFDWKNVLWWQFIYGFVFFFLIIVLRTWKKWNVISLAHRRICLCDYETRVKNKVKHKKRTREEWAENTRLTGCYKTIRASC